VRRQGCVYILIRRRQVLAGAAQAPAVSALSPLSNRPNILLLCIDELNDWLDYLGNHPGVHNPNVD